MNITTLGLIKKIGNKTEFVKKDSYGNGYLFNNNADESMLSVTEVVNGDSTVIFRIEFDSDGELVELTHYSESYESELFIEEEISELFQLFEEDGLIVYEY